MSARDDRKSQSLGRPITYPPLINMNLKHDEEYLATAGPEVFVEAHADAAEMCRQYLQHMHRFIPASEWHDDDGDVLWYRLPVTESPYVGSPLDVGWHGEPFAILLNGETRAEYFTHFQHIHTPEH